MSVTLPKVFYLADPYISHRLAAQGNCRALQALGCLTDSLEAADIVVVHQELARLGTTLGRLPAANSKYRVGFLVGETNPLRPELTRAFAQLAEIWTPSLFSARSFIASHPQVYFLPHVVPQEPKSKPRLTPAEEAAETTVARWLAPQRGAVFVLGVGMHEEPRKNVQQLRRAVQAARLRAPALCMLLKSRAPTAVNVPRVVYAPGEIDIRGPIDPLLMHTLTKRAHITASAHRSEGWGLPLSDGLRLGHVVVATDYSGSRGLVSPPNGLVVPCSLRKSGQAGRRLHFAEHALWAEPWQLYLEDQLVEACGRVQAAGKHNEQREGRRDMARYGERRLLLLLRGRLKAIAKTLAARI